jgi:endonuclease V-like protein UPF0215 family
MKNGIRLLAVSSGPIYERKKHTTLLVGLVGRLGTIEGVLSEKVAIDGTDATSKIIKMFAKSRFKEQIKAIAINGVALAGLNVVDVKALERKTGVPVLVLTRHRPDKKAFAEALKKYQRIDSSADKRMDIVKSLNKERPFLRVGGFYIQCKKDYAADKAVVETAFEMLRLAHMIAKGVSTGVSKGRI